MTSYSVPNESKALFVSGILGNDLMKDLPWEVKKFSKLVQFEGNDFPCIPINWRFAESISALKAFEATMLNVLLARKYNMEPASTKINTDHACLFFMSPLLAQVVGSDGKPDTDATPGPAGMEKYFPNRDLHRSMVSFHRTLATNIYKTKDGKFYHTHGSLNPEPTLTALGLSLEGEATDTYNDVIARIQKQVLEKNSAELDTLMNCEHKQAGTIAWTSEEYFSSKHGESNSGNGLYTLFTSPNTKQIPSWWPNVASTSASRPLAGLKVVDLTRVIAGPAITRSLAEMGASVMRVTSPLVTDLSSTHQDLNWGKWNCHLDLNNAQDKKKLVELILDADIVVDGYRPGVMEKWGFGREAIFGFCKDRSRGIIHVRENCYGWNGPWKDRSGWQQISDACCGVSMEYGRAMGNEEAVTPVFPNSDYCTGVAGSVGVLHALIKRGESGQSYGVDVSLNYYTQWLVRSCGTYPPAVWSKLWSDNGSLTFRHYHAMSYLLPAMMKTLMAYGATSLFHPSFFEVRQAKNLGVFFRSVKPVIQYPNGEVNLRYNIGTRGNGTDKPKWPEDLGVEIVT